MILILKLDLDMVKMYHHTKYQVSMSTHSKVIAQTDKQTDIRTHTDMMKALPLLHTQEVIIVSDPISHNKRYNIPEIVSNIDIDPNLGVVSNCG